MSFCPANTFKTLSVKPSQQRSTGVSAQLSVTSPVIEAQPTPSSSSDSRMSIHSQENPASHLGGTNSRPRSPRSAGLDGLGPPGEQGSQEIKFRWRERVDDAARAAGKRSASAAHRLRRPWSGVPSTSSHLLRLALASTTASLGVLLVISAREPAGEGWPVGGGGGCVRAPVQRASRQEHVRF
jgi:hypothetical protein